MSIEKLGSCPCLRWPLFWIKSSWVVRHIRQSTVCNIFRETRRGSKLSSADVCRINDSYFQWTFYWFVTQYKLYLYICTIRISNVHIIVKLIHFSFLWELKKWFYISRQIELYDRYHLCIIKNAVLRFKHIIIQL